MEVKNGFLALDKLPGERDPTHLHRVLVISLHLACLLVKTMGEVSESRKMTALKVNKKRRNACILNRLCDYIHCLLSL